MGLFGKKRSSDTDLKHQVASKPFVADDQIIARVAELMRMFNDAVGNDAMLRATASSISSAAGLDDIKQAVYNPALLEQPWKMLAAVALRAAQNDDHFLAARIFGFTSVWGTQIAPHLGPADWFDIRLDKIPPVIEAEIAAVALGSLQQLSDEQVIFGNATGSLTAGVLTRAAAIVIVDAPEKGIPIADVVMAAAKGVVG